MVSASARPGMPTMSPHNKVIPQQVCLGMFTFKAGHERCAISLLRLDQAVGTVAVSSSQLASVVESRHQRGPEEGSGEERERGQRGEKEGRGAHVWMRWGSAPWKARAGRVGAEGVCVWWWVCVVVVGLLKGTRVHRHGATATATDTATDRDVHGATINTASVASSNV